MSDQSDPDPLWVAELESEFHKALVSGHAYRRMVRLDESPSNEAFITRPILAFAVLTPEETVSDLDRTSAYGRCEPPHEGASWAEPAGRYLIPILDRSVVLELNPQKLLMVDPISDMEEFRRVLSQAFPSRWGLPRVYFLRRSGPVFTMTAKDWQHDYRTTYDSLSGHSTRLFVIDEIDDKIIYDSNLLRAADAAKQHSSVLILDWPTRRQAADLGCLLRKTDMVSMTGRNFARLVYDPSGAECLLAKLEAQEEAREKSRIDPLPYYWLERLFLDLKESLLPLGIDIPLHGHSHAEVADCIWSQIQVFRLTFGRSALWSVESFRTVVDRWKVSGEKSRWRSIRAPRPSWFCLCNLLDEAARRSRKPAIKPLRRNARAERILQEYDGDLLIAKKTLNWMSYRCGVVIRVDYRSGDSEQGSLDRSSCDLLRFRPRGSRKVKEVCWDQVSELWVSRPYNTVGFDVHLDASNAEVAIPLDLQEEVEE